MESHFRCLLGTCEGFVIISSTCLLSCVVAVLIFKGLAAMANANHVRGEKSDLPGSPSVSRGPQVEDVLLRELEEELQCHGCRKEHGKMSCAACGTSSYCGMLIHLEKGRDF
jgi:hypothetical protein